MGLEVKVVRPGRTFKEIFVAPSGFSQGLEEVLIVVEGVHQVDFTQPPVATPYQILPTPPADSKDPQQPAISGGESTDADRLRQQYRQAMEAQGVKLGAGGPVGREAQQEKWHPAGCHSSLQVVRVTS